MKNNLNRSLYSNSNSEIDCCEHKRMLQKCSQNYKQKRLSWNKNARSQKNICDQHTLAESARLYSHTNRKKLEGPCIITTRCTNCNCISNESDSLVQQKILNLISDKKCLKCPNCKSVQHMHRQSREKKLSKKITNMLIQQQHKSKIAGEVVILSQNKQHESNKIKFAEKSKKNNKQEFLEDFTHAGKNLNGSQEFLLGRSQSSKASHYAICQNPATFRNNNASINSQENRWLDAQNEFFIKNSSMSNENRIKRIEKGEENNKQNLNKQNINQISRYRKQKLYDQQQRQVQERRSITLNNYIKSCQNKSISSNNLQSYFQHSSSISSQVIQNRFNQKADRKRISINYKQTFQVNRKQLRNQSTGQLSDSEQSESNSNYKKNMNSKNKIKQNSDFTLKKRKKTDEIEVLKQVRELKDIILNVLHLKQTKTDLISDPDSRLNTINFLENN